MVYRYVVITDNQERISKAAGIPEPALLSACAILRAETWAIFHLENTFLCEVDSYDPATLQLAQQKEQMDSPAADAERVVIHNLRIDKSGRRSWNNLVA